MTFRDLRQLYAGGRGEFPGEWGASTGRGSGEPEGTERSSGASKGFGFLEYGNDDEARAAIAGLDGRDVNGQSLKVNESRPRPR